ncbi:MAG: hypothetical protein JW918_11685 [Anaerolineae bacterium]|nr:hypothetical protein [Anaerolineae bacterium]
MLDRLQHMIQRLANGRAILILLAAVIALRVIMGLPNDPFGLNPRLTRLGGAAILDMQIGYTPKDAYALLEGLGAEGRQAYAAMLLIGDTLFLISYSLLFAAVAAWLLARVAPPDHWAQKLSLIALVGGISDIAENLSILTMILAFPQRLDGIAWFSSLIKITKFGSAAVGAPLIMVFAVMLVWKRTVGRRRQSV